MDCYLLMSPSHQTFTYLRAQSMCSGLKLRLAFARQDPTAIMIGKVGVGKTTIFNKVGGVI